MQVRVATMGDLAEVDALLARSYPRLLKHAYPPSVLVTALPLISRAQPRLLGSGRYYVAVGGDGRIRGAGGWSRDRADARLGHVRHVATDPDHLRRGVGRALMARILGAARAAGMTRMACWATRNAVPFYESTGFVAEGPMEVPLQPGITFPAVRMGLDLAKAAAWE